MHVIAVSNQKGGVAKTTTAVALASAFALAGRRVVAIDVDPQANLGLGFGAAPGPEAPTLHDVLVRRVGIPAAARPVTLPGHGSLCVVPAGPRLAQAEAELLGQVGFDEVLKTRLRACEDHFDVAVLDCPPSLGALTINAVGAADLVVVPVQCEFFSARGVARVLEVVDLVRERRNPHLRLLVVPVLYDQRNGICRAVLAELRRELGAEVSGHVVGIDTRVREAQARGVPINVLAPRSRAAVAYEAVAREIEAALRRGVQLRDVHGQQEVLRAQAA